MGLKKDVQPQFSLAGNNVRKTVLSLRKKPNDMNQMEGENLKKGYQKNFTLSKYRAKNTILEKERGAFKLTGKTDP